MDETVAAASAVVAVAAIVVAAGTATVTAVAAMATATARVAEVPGHPVLSVLRSVAKNSKSGRKGAKAVAYFCETNEQVSAAERKRKGRRQHMTNTEWGGETGKDAVSKKMGNLQHGPAELSTGRTKWLFTMAALAAKTTAMAGVMTVMTATTQAAATVMVRTTAMMPSMMKMTAMMTMTQQWQQ